MTSVLKFIFKLTLICILLHLLAIVGAWAAQNFHTQVHELVRQLRSNDIAVRRDAADALVKLGPAAIQPLGTALQGNDDDLASASAVILGEIGSPSIPVLVNALNDKKFSFNARRIRDVVTALGSIGPEAVPIMIEAIADKKGFKSHTLLIMKALIDVGPPAIPGLIKSLNHAPPPRRFIVAVVLRDLNDASAVPALGELLNDEYREVRSIAALSLQKYGQKAKAAVPALLAEVDVLNPLSIKKAESLKWEPYVNFRAAAIGALVVIAPEADDVFNTFIKALRDDDSEVRSASAAALGNMGRRAITAMPHLLIAIRDVNGQVRKEVVAALGKIDPKAENILPALMEALNDRNPAVRGEVAIAFGRMRTEAKTVVPILVQLLSDTNVNVRSVAATALGQIGREAKVAVPVLISALKDSDNRVRQNAAKALANMGPGSIEAVSPLMEYFKREIGDNQRDAVNALRQIGPAAIPALISSLHEQDPMIRQYAAQALGQIVPKTEEAVPALIAALKDENPKVRKEVVSALGNIGSKAIASVPALYEALKDEDSSVRVQAANSLGSLGPDARAAIPSLIDALNDKDLELCRASVNTLGRIGPEARDAVPALVEFLKGNDVDLRRIAARALGGIGPVGAAAVPALIGALKDENSGIRRDAAIALGKIGAAARPAIPGLIKALNDDTDIRGSAADALVDIAAGLQDASAADSVEELKQIYDAFGNISALVTEKHAKYEHAKSVDRAIKHLELIWWKDSTKSIFSWSSEHPLVVGIIISYFLWILTCLLFLCFWPLVLLRINDILKSFEIKLFDRPLEMKLSLRSFLLVSFFCSRTKVLDAWVSSHVDLVQKKFSEKDTVAYRQVHITMPVTIDGNIVTELTGSHLRPTFENRIGCLLIWGEGGSGKTSLACHVAKWAMSEEPDSRISKHLMLPVLIEEELDSEVPVVAASLNDAIRRQLQILCDEAVPISEELLDQLLRRQRILVIIDHLSEMSAATLAKVQPGASHFACNALIVTSRLEEDLGGVHKTVIKPLRIAGNRLSSFMENYLTQRKKRELFTDPEFFDSCRKLSEMVGDREVTVLLAKLYAEQLILIREKVSGEELPNNIPDLMILYLNEINRGVFEGKIDDSTVHRDAKIIAWECLKQNYRPTHALIADVCDAIGRDDPIGRLRYLENRLRLIHTIQPAQERIRFLLDPLAEYLAGLYVIETNANNEDKWKEFLTYGLDVQGAPAAIRGFLLAIRDCCVARQNDVNIPEFVINEINMQFAQEEKK